MGDVTMLQSRYVVSNIYGTIHTLCVCDTGIQDLRNFVSVALQTTAGETDYDSDLLSNLKKVGNGFRSLIFDLVTDKSFEAFRKGCLTVWEAMETAPDLPDKLVSIYI